MSECSKGHGSADTVEHPALASTLPQTKLPRLALCKPPTKNLRLVEDLCEGFNVLGHLDVLLKAILKRVIGGVIVVHIGHREVYVLHTVWYRPS